MKIICISDTHGHHDKIEDLPDGDGIINAGDISGLGTFYQIKSFVRWYSSLPYRHKIFIAGNHDFGLDDVHLGHKEMLTNMFRDAGLTYLEDSGVTIEGVKIWGSPITPRFGDWAFMRDRGDDIKHHWDKIPIDTDILITHGPPQGILDLTSQNIHAGCADLLYCGASPKYHIFGHIHEGYGIEEVNDTTYINASLLNERYQLVNQPIVIEI